MNKKLLSLTLALILCFSLLAGCNNTPNPSNTPAPGNTTSPGNTETPENTPASADDGKIYEFVVTNHDAATSMGQLYLQTLFDQISEESGGRLKFSYFPGGSLFGATEAADAVKEGSADICWSCTSFYGGVFPISEFVNLPASGITCARMGGEVIQTMVKEIPEVAAEYNNWHVLAFHASSYAPISTVGKKIESPSDFKGMQIRAAGTIPTMYINALGATAISMPTSEVYEALSKGVINGMANDWHNIDCFNLFEPIDYCLDTPVNTATCFVLMNKDKYEALPDDLKALMDKYSESGFAGDMAGYWWDSCNFWVGEKMIEKGVEVYSPSQELYDYMYSDEMRSQVHQTYIDYLNGFGIDGQAMYDKCMEIVARYADEYADPFATPFHYTDWDMSSVDGYQG